MSAAAETLATPAQVRRRFNWGRLAFLVPVHASLLLAPWTFSKSFTARRPLTYLLVTLGALTIQGGPSAWVANHRRHHRSSDGPGDPHDASQGFWWAHMGWIFAGVPPEDAQRWRRRYAPDMLGNAYFRFLDRWYWALQIPLGLALLAAGGWGMVVWGVGVRLVATYHTTYLVNSAAHRFGYRTYRTDDRSRNTWWVALLAYGEGWHNNHHAFPWSARHGLRRWEIDPAYLAIRLFRVLGLVSTVHVPSPDRRRARAGVEEA